MITHTSPPQRLLRYTTAVEPSDSVEVETIQLHPNSGLAIVSKGNEDHQVRVSQLDPEDGETFDAKTYDVPAAGKTIYHRGAAGAALIELIAGADGLEPDLRVYGMSQP